MTDDVKAAPSVEELLDIADIDGDLNLDVRQGRAYVSVEAEGDGLAVLSAPDTVQALQELTRTQTPPERTRALRHTITRTLQTELPVIPVAWYRQHVAVAPRLAGVTLDPLERSYRLTGMEWNNP